MDYAVLAATAFGAIGLYWMLPREKAPLVRLGALVGGMAAAGFFLYLVRMVATSGKLVAEGPPVYFYLFGLIMIAGAVGVVCQPKPVYAALYFVLITLAGAGMFVLLLAEFMAIVLIIIYAGAILVTYVFVIMLASRGSVGGQVESPEYDRRASEPFVAVLVAFLLIGTVLQVLLPGGPKGKEIAKASDKPDRLMALNLGESPAGATVSDGAATAPATGPAVASLQDPPSSVQVLGVNLYSQYALSLELAGILLTVALVGAVVISRKGEVKEHALGSGQLPAE
jgi:NADH-quinone oxidoreductase subunit J